MTDADLKPPKDILISEPHPRMERESFLGGRYRVLSRSGLSRGDRLMLEVFENLAAPRVLDILESWTGVPGMIAHDLFPEADITFHCLDLFHARRLETNLSRNEMVVP
ncbi:hypothetical protein HQ520_03430, partial [bacterium]|nr:hypothetical protein [bacterium]